MFSYKNDSVRLNNGQIFIVGKMKLIPPKPKMHTALDDLFQSGM